MSNQHGARVRVELGERGYDVCIGPRQLDHLAEFVQQQTLRFSRAIIITDDRVGPLYAARVQAQLEQQGPVSLTQVPAGEASKSIEQAEGLWETMLGEGAGRDAMVVGLGGGVVGDLAGFVAATYARGVRFLQVPTTLLAQVDSSVGGKVGINLSTAKNMVGAFWQPAGVVIDTDVLVTLPAREYQAGLAEVIKYGVIDDAAFFEKLESQQAQIAARDDAILQEVIARCCEIKAEVVAADETERSGRREILNYGHTFAHAIEALTGYGTWLHGEAVAIGMTCAMEMAVRLGMVERSEADRQAALIRALGLPTTMPAPDHERFLEVMRTDKKARKGQIRLVLSPGIGAVRTVEIRSAAELRLIEASLNAVSE
ncbi:MAG: 3-dehydroquinate synthase [Planctomycetota bacterium]